MKVEQGQAAIVTGAGRGIGRALAVALAKRGVQVTILDLNSSDGEQTVSLVQEEHAKISYKPPNSQPSAIFIQCDVTKSEDLAAAFARHQEVFGKLDICINNAGLLAVTPFYEDPNWKKMVDVNLTAVIDGTGKAIQAMREHGGLILNVSSRAAITPADNFTVYGATKAGVAMFTRSLANLGMGIRVNAICPEFVDTGLLDSMPPPLMDIIRNQMGFVTLEKVVEAAFTALEDESMAGECLWVPSRKPIEVWPDEETKIKYGLQN